MTAPIKPSEIVKVHSAAIPDIIIETFNDAIIKNWDGREAYFTQDSIADALRKKGFNMKEVYEKHQLDVEPLFRKAGWIVEYDAPGYCEDYKATFKFRKKRAK